jgi:hypothetical protein
MTDGDERALLLAKRWAVFAQRPRKDVARVYQALDDVQLADLFRLTNQTLAITMKLDNKRFDSSPEALRIRAMSTEDRKRVRQEALIAATRIRDEFRRRSLNSRKP